jgi:acetamidase/formamidase
MKRKIPSASTCVPALLAGQVRQVTPKTYYHTFSGAHPVLDRIRPGEVIATKTIDAGGQDEGGVWVSQPSNPQTGPFYVEGAQPGDALVVRIQKLRMNRNFGWSNYRLLLNSLAPEQVEGIYSDHYKQDLVRKGRYNLVPWDIDLASGMLRLREPSSARVKLEYPARPMLGCIGVAAPGETASATGISGPYGGNLDYNEIAEGATVILPVYHPGALLFVGDGHALQADGEPLGTGIETSMDLEFSVEVRQGVAASGPRVETAEELISIGSQPEFASSLDRALQLATTDMLRWLVQEYGVEDWAAHMIAGLHGRYQVVTVAGSMALRIPKRWLPKP